MIIDMLLAIHPAYSLISYHQDMVNLWHDDISSFKRVAPLIFHRLGYREDSIKEKIKSKY